MPSSYLNIDSDGTTFNAEYRRSCTSIAAFLDRLLKYNSDGPVSMKDNKMTKAPTTISSSTKYGHSTTPTTYLTTFFWFGFCLLWLCVVPGGAAPAAGATMGSLPSGPNLAMGQKRIKDCCRLTEMPEDCMSLCKYKANLTELICKAETCHPHFKRWMYCASDTMDNSACCRKRNVPDVCMPFCQGISLPSKELFGADFLQCTDPKVMNQIFQCHLDGLGPDGKWIDDYNNNHPELHSNDPLPPDKMALLEKLANESCQNNQETMVRQLRQMKTDNKKYVV